MRPSTAALAEAVFEAVRGVGCGVVLGAVWRHVLGGPWVGAPTPDAVGRSLRRLQKAGRVFLHDGHGTLAIWKSVRGVCWSTRESLISDYGYDDSHFQVTT